jgi:AcrR family transcriptional regulator
MNVNRRTQADRTASTRAALVAAARSLFSEHGFGDVGTEAIVRAAGVTRGALYHQFGDKRGLFEAVFEHVEAESTAAVGAAVAESGVTDPISALEIGADAWLEICKEPDVHRIVLIEAPAVLGWARWRELGMQHALGLVEGLLAQAIAVGQIREQPVRPLAHVLIGAIDEAAMFAARAPDGDAARDEVRAVVGDLLTALRASG